MNSNNALLLRFCERHPAHLLAEDETMIHLVVTTAPQEEEIEHLRFFYQKHVTIEIVSDIQFGELIQTREKLTDKVPEVFTTEDPASSVTLSTVDYCHKILDDAITQRASDIHIEPQQSGSRLRLRVDGVLHWYEQLSHTETITVQSRFKLLAGCDIAESRRPQDGQLVFQHKKKQYSFRLATLPTRFGEKLVLRLLETFQGALKLESLGMPNEQLALFTSALARPQGLIIVTGPTGSGKTATLYSALNHLNTETRNLCSVEDPVELVIAGINQTQINLKAGLDFALILRALLRQDPDILMIGEIRDNQTADIAIKAAQTGHLVLTTLHTNSTIDTLCRLNQMGIANYLIASSLRLIIAQRLVRRLCTKCCEPAVTPIRTLSTNKVLKHWRAKGCQHCISGYRGRTPLFELLHVDQSIQSAIIAHNDSHRLRALSREKKIVSLYEAGLLAVEQGITSYSELLRVIGDETA